MFTYKTPTRLILAGSGRQIMSAICLQTRGSLSKQLLGASARNVLPEKDGNFKKTGNVTLILPVNAKPGRTVAPCLKAFSPKAH